MTKNTIFAAQGYLSPCVEIAEVEPGWDILAASSEITPWVEDTDPLSF